VTSKRSLRDAHSAYFEQPGTWAAIEMAGWHGLLEVKVPDGRWDADAVMERYRAFHGDLATSIAVMRDEATAMRDEATASLLEAIEVYTKAADRLGASIDLAVESARLRVATLKLRTAWRRIMRKEVDATELEDSQSKYYLIDGQLYVVESGRIDEARAAAIVAALLPVRRPGEVVPERGWLALIVDSGQAVTHQARTLLDERGVDVFPLYGTTAEHAQAVLAEATTGPSNTEPEA
jgi:hypothetical protein